MVSIPRYAIAFIEMPAEIRRQLNRGYFRLIWDDRRKGGVIRDLQSCCPKSLGGIGSLDLKSIVNASVIKMVTRALNNSDLPWVILTKELIVKSAGVPSMFPEAMTNPWLQRLSSTHTLPSELRHIWLRWKKLYSPGRSSMIYVNFPQMREEVLHTYIWYHPMIGTGPGAGARRWGSGIWRQLWAFGVRLLSHVWDPNWDRGVISLDGYSPTVKAQAIAAIHNMMSSIPQEWVALLESPAPELTITEHSIARDEYYLKTGSAESRPKRIHEINFTRAYRTLLANRLENVDFRDRTLGLIQAFSHRTSLNVTSARLWAAARTQLGIPKPGDLLWRLLHQKVEVGRDLNWLPEPQQECPIHRCSFTLSHIWVDCIVADAVWTEMNGIQSWITEGTEAPPQSVNEFIALMALSPVSLKGVGKRRWTALYQTAAWCLWKAYLSVAFGLPHCYWNPEAATGYDKEMMQTRILSDRVLSMKELYQNKDYNPSVFKELWGQYPDEIRILKGPDCMNRGVVIEKDSLEGDQRRVPLCHLLDG